MIRDSDVDAGRCADKQWQFKCTCAMVFLPEKWSRQSWHHYVTSWGSLMVEKGGNYIRRAWLNLGAFVTVVWVFGYKAFGFVNKPQTLYLGCISAPWGGSITRMDIATYLSICMHPDLSGGLLVSTTLVVWRQLGRSLPSPLEPGIKWNMDHNPSVANCEVGDKLLVWCESLPVYLVYLCLPQMWSDCHIYIWYKVDNLEWNTKAVWPYCSIAYFQFRSNV